MTKYIFFFLSILLLSCKERKKTFSTNQVFKYNEHSNINSLDPAFAKNQANIWVTNQLFSGLVQLDDNLSIKPDIAKKWSISKDGKIYSFILRKEVKFHKHKLFGKDSTRNVTANDFVYSFKRLTNPKLAAPGGWVLKNVSSFNAKNDSTFVIKLKQPFPPFLGLLSMKYCSVVPKEIVEYYGKNFRTNPIGTGAFKFKLWIENTKLILRKNNLYYEKENGNKLPYLEAISISFLPDKQSEFIQFIQGNLDFLNSIDPSYKDDILTENGNLKPKYDHKITMQKSPFLNTEYLGFLVNGDKNEANSKLIRQAINYGFDRVKMIHFLRNNIGIPAENGFIPKGLPSFSNKKWYTYNPVKAKKLVNKYVKQHNKKPKITIATNSQYVDLCEYIQRELQKIGITVAIDVMPPATLRQGKANTKLPFFRGSWIADYPDAENYLSLFYSKNFAPKGPNYCHFKNALFDQLYEESLTITNSKKRIVLNKKMDSLIMDNAPIVPLYYDEAIRFTQKNVKGITTNGINILNLKRVFKE